MIGKCKWQFKCNLSSQHDPSSRGGGAAALGTAAARPKRSRAGPGPPGCSAPRSAPGNTAGEHHHLPASLTHFSEMGVQLQGSTSSPARPREAAGHRQAAQPGTASALQLRRDLRVPDRPVPPRCSALCGCERGRRWSSSVGLRSVALHSGVRRCSECSWSPSQPSKASTHPHADFGLSPCSPPSHWPRICVQTQSSEHSTAAHSSSTAAAALSPPCRAALTVAQPRVLGSSHGAPSQRTGPGQSTAITVCPRLCHTEQCLRIPCSRPIGVPSWGAAWRGLAAQQRPAAPQYPCTVTPPSSPRVQVAGLCSPSGTKLCTLLRCCGRTVWFRQAGGQRCRLPQQPRSGAVPCSTPHCPRAGSSSTELQHNGAHEGRAALCPETTWLGEHCSPETPQLL